MYKKRNPTIIFLIKFFNNFDKSLWQPSQHFDFPIFGHSIKGFCYSSRNAGQRV